MSKHPGNDGDLVYALVGKQCNLNAIQDLLRTYKALSKDIRVTAENKHELIAKNLRPAVDRRLIPIERVWNLIRDSEENGAQHIFFFQPRSASIAARYSEGSQVAKKLWGKDWEETKAFPHLRDGPPEQPEWCDFRAAPSGWIAKMYGSAVRYESVGQEEEIGVDPVDGATIYQRKFKRIIERTVLLIRWRKSGFLELRVPTWASRRVVEKMRDLLWSSSRDAISAEDFKPWKLNSCGTRMVREFAKHRTMYAFSDTQVRDSGKGTITFSPLDDEDTLFAVAERQQAVEVLLQPRKNSCERLVVNFLRQDSPHAIADDLRVVLSAHDANELVIGARTTETVVDYVIDRLRDLA